TSDKDKDAGRDRRPALPTTGQGRRCRDRRVRAGSEGWSQTEPNVHAFDDHVYEPGPAYEPDLACDRACRIARTTRRSAWAREMASSADITGCDTSNA